MRALIIGLVLVVAGAAMASEAPGLGTVHNTKDKGWLTYVCEEVGAESLTCDMTQVMIRKKLDPANVQAKYQEAVQNWPAVLLQEYNASSVAELMASKQMRELCEQSTTYLGALHGGDGSRLPPEARSGLARMSPLQRRDAEQQFGAIVESCNFKTLDGLKRSARLALERDARTCTVSTNAFKQTFRPVRNSDGKLLSWNYADATPQGECGMIQLSRFRPADPDGKTDTIFWQYIAKRATSNPEGSHWLASCKDFDESETLYDWRSSEIALQCDYIEYSPI